MASTRLGVPFASIGGIPSQATSDVLSGRAAALLFVLLCGIALFPIAWFSTLPLLDYPNHMARFLMLGMDEQALRKLGFTVYEALQLNLAADLIVPLLAQAFGVEQATRIYVITCLTATCGAVVALARVVNGRWTVASFACALFATSTWVMMGFLNFLGGVALALWSGVLLYVIRSRALPLRVLVGAALMAVCGIAHVASMMVLGALVFAMALEAVVLRQGRVRTEAIFVAAVGLAAVGLFLSQPAHGGAGGYWVGPNGTRWFLLNKINLVLSGFGWMWSRADRVIAALALGTLGWLLVRGRASIAMMPACAALVLVVGLVVLPFGAGGGWFVDGRLGWPIALLAAASIRFDRITSGQMRWLVAGLLMAATARSAFVVHDWDKKVERIEQFRRLLTAMPEGRRIANLPSLWETHREGPWNESHLPTYAMLDRGAVAASIFARPFIFSSTVEWLPDHSDTDLQIFVAEFAWHQRGWQHASQVLRERWDYAVGYGEAELKQLGAGWRVAARQGPFARFENTQRVRSRETTPRADGSSHSSR